MTMNIKKTVAVMLCAVFAAAMLSGCVSSTTVKEKDAIILIVSDSTEDIVSRVENGEYADAVFVLGDEALNALDAAAEGKDFIVHSSRVALNSEDGAQYAIAVLNNSDRQSVVQGFIDYLMSDEAADVLGGNGLKK